jgi:hypothetical protein
VLVKNATIKVVRTTRKPSTITRATPLLEVLWIDFMLGIAFVEC